MIIALNIFMAGLVLVGIVTLLARSIQEDTKTAIAVRSPVEPATVRGARTRDHRTAPSRRTVGVH